MLLRQLSDCQNQFLLELHVRVCLIVLSFISNQRLTALKLTELDQEDLVDQIELLLRYQVIILAETVFENQACNLTDVPLNVASNQIEN